MQWGWNEQVVEFDATEQNSTWTKGHVVSGDWYLVQFAVSSVLTVFSLGLETALDIVARLARVRGPPRVCASTFPSLERQGRIKINDEK